MRYNTEVILMENSSVTGVTVKPGNITATSMRKVDSNARETKGNELDFSIEFNPTNTPFDTIKVEFSYEIA
jgi:hypothetical protein